MAQATPGIRLGRNGRLHVGRHASWDAVAEQYYTQLAAACA